MVFSYILSQYIIILFIRSTFGLQVLDVIGPTSVRNGSTDYVILDCPFQSDEKDRSGLVIKWYFNEQPVPVYQWIPGQKPQDFGILRGRLDLKHKASQDSWAEHRALAIVKPTIDLSGQYKCIVSSFYSEDSKRKNLVVYVPASGAELTYSKPSLSSVVLNCNALGLYPQPQVSVYRRRPYVDRIHRSVIGEPELSTSVTNDTKSFNVTARVTLFDFELRGETVFICEISLPGTPYHLQKEIHYSPKIAQRLISVSSARKNCSRMAVLMTMTILFLINRTITSYL